MCVGMVSRWWVLAVAWCVLAGPGTARAAIGHNMSELSRRLQLEMADVLELAAVNYSQPVLNATYLASVQFDMRAMGPLYNNTHIIIDYVSQKEAYPEGIVSVVDHNVEVADIKSHWKPLLTHYAGPTAILVCVLLVAAILPLAGLFWCCCHWCRVGRRRRPFDRKYDACIKGLLAIVMICLLTLFLFGVVGLFATDSQTEEGLREAGAALRLGAGDADTFLAQAAAHAAHLLVTNYNELVKRLDHVLETSGAMISLKLSQFSRAVSVSALHQIVDKLGDVKADLETVQRSVADLRIKADELNIGLRKVRNQLLQTLKNCSHSKCIQLQEKYNIGQLSTEIQYSQMPDVSDLLSNVSAVLATPLREEVAAGQRVFDGIEAGVRRSVQHHIPAIQAHLHALGKRLEQLSNNITEQANSARAEVKIKAAWGARLDELHGDWGMYRRHAGRAGAAAPLLVTCLLAWGLVCGVCGKRPDHYGAADCCNKGQGAKCLYCGVCVIFLVGGVMAALLALYFVVGFAGTKFICDPLTEPRDNRLFADLEKFVNLEHVVFQENTDPDFNMTFVILNCHQNKTIYEALSLWRKVDVEAWAEEARREVAARAAALRPAFPPATTVLSAAAARQLRDLARSPLAHFDFDTILQALETNMTSLGLDQLQRQLQSTADSLRGRAELAEEARKLQETARELHRLQTSVVDVMHNKTNTLNRTAERLRDSLRFNHSSLEEAITHLLREADEAERFLNAEGPQRLTNLTQSFAMVLELKISEYLELVAAGARGSVGRCGPLSNAYNATRDAFCSKILMPVNGYWVSMAWCVVLFVPIMVVAQRLARLYLHVDPYPGPLVEAGSKRSTLDIEGKIAEWRERSGAPSAPPPSALGDTPSPSLAPAPAPGAPLAQGTALLLSGDEVVCTLLPPAALITDLKSRLDAKDEDNESGIHDAE